MVNTDAQKGTTHNIIQQRGDNMRKAILIFAAALSSLIINAAQTIDTYRLTMRLKVPRIYDNMASMGYRKLQLQRIVGDLQITYGDDGSTKVQMKNLVNRTHKINGIPISYVCYDYPYDYHNPRVVAIGSNRTGKFNTGGIEFAFQADPSYNIGEVDEDNTLILELSGYGTLKGNTLKNLKGSVKG